MLAISPEDVLSSDTSTKKLQKQIWSSVNNPGIGGSLQWVSEALAESLNLKPDQKVLDVAAGHGDFTLAACRRQAKTVSTDIVPGALKYGKKRLLAHALEAEYGLADAENLPFASATFDVAASTFGVMFTLEPYRVAGELMRVLRDDGKIGLVNWQPGGFVGQVLKTIGGYVPEAVNLQSLEYWGTRRHVESLFSDANYRLEFKDKQHIFRYRTSGYWLSLFHRNFAPLHYAFSVLDSAAVASLVRDLFAVSARFDISGNASLVAPSQYLECVIVKAG